MKQYEKQLLSNINSIPLDELYEIIKSVGLKLRLRNEEIIYSEKPHYMTTAVFEK
jgi:hypothetical protein